MPVSILPMIGDRGERTLPDPTLLGIWRQMVAERKVEAVFYAGGVASADDFLRFAAKHAGRMVHAVADDGRMLGLAWLTNVEDGSAFLHYCSLGRFRRDAARKLLGHFAALGQPDGRPLLDRLLGITPEVNLPALRVLRQMGFTTLGTIPGYCRLAHQGTRCGGVISFLELRRGDSEALSCEAAGTVPCPATLPRS